MSNKLNLIDVDAYLIFDIRSIAELIDPDGQEIRFASSLHILRHIEFGWISRALAIAHFTTIQPDMERGVHSLKTEA